jgi:hypothetical protein
MRQAIINLADRRGDGDHPGLILQRYLAKQNDAGEHRALFYSVLKPHATTRCVACMGSVRALDAVLSGQ